MKKTIKGLKECVVPQKVALRRRSNLIFKTKAQSRFIRKKRTNKQIDAAVGHKFQIIAKGGAGGSRLMQVAY